MKIALPFSLRRLLLAQEGFAPRLRRRMNKPLWPLIGIGLIVIIVLLAWWISSRQSKIPTPVSTGVVQDDIEVVVESSGKTQAARSIEIPIQIAGRVIAVPVTAGQHVKAG